VPRVGCSVRLVTSAFFSFSSFFHCLCLSQERLEGMQARVRDLRADCSALEEDLEVARALSNLGPLSAPYLGRLSTPYLGPI